MNSPTAETSTALPHGIECDLAIVGAGPAGSAAAYHAARAGLEVVLVDMADVPGTSASSLGRDKTCGDGLTPRAIAALESMGALSLLLSLIHL